MSAPAVPQPNAFQETLLGLAYADRPQPADLFSRVCVDQYREMDLTRFGYLLAQVFEPNVLMEVALLADVRYEDVVTLAHRPTAAVGELAGMVAQRRELPLPGLVNLASALISVSRFALASEVLVEAATRAERPRDHFEVAMLEFIVANRRDGGSGSTDAFRRMRTAIESGQIPGHRTLDACTQAIVWFMKRREVPEELFRWFVRVGHSLVRDQQDLEPGAVSAWYRGLAMSPAAQGDIALTRRYMDNARAAADESVAQRPYAYELHLVKTYHESSIKEHMYVTRDLDKAVESAHALIALDPTWAPSHGELGDAYLKFGKAGLAASVYDTALEFGPPYYGHHLLQSARAHAKAGAAEQALERYRQLSDLIPDDPSLLTAALELAQEHSHGSQAHFAEALDRLGTAPPTGSEV